MKNKDEELIDFPNPYSYANTNDTTAISHDILFYFMKNHTAYAVYAYAVAHHGGRSRKQIKERWKISDKKLDIAIKDINNYFANIHAPIYDRNQPKEAQTQTPQGI